MNELTPFDNQGAIVRVEATPRLSPGQDPEKTSWYWKLYSMLVKPKLKRGGELAEAYAEAVVSQKQSEAEKAAGEAARILDENEHKAKMNGQEYVKEVVANVDRIGELETPQQQMIGLAMLVKETPGLKDALEDLEEVMTRLSYKNGLSIQAVNKDDILPPAALIKSEPSEARSASEARKEVQWDGYVHSGAWKSNTEWKETTAPQTQDDVTVPGVVPVVPKAKKKSSRGKGRKPKGK